MRNTSAFTKILLVFFSIVIALLLVEGYLRAKETWDGRHGPLYTVDENGLTLHRPNLDFEVFSDEANRYARFKTNAEGFVGRDYAVQKPADIYRIAVLGDSFVEARQVDYDKNFSALLEQKLGAGYEVMNFGVGNINTKQEEYYYDAYVEKYRPDLLLLVLFTGNDFTNTDKNAENTDLPAFEPQGAIVRALNMLGAYSRLAEFLYNAALNAGALSDGATPFERENTLRALYPFLKRETLDVNEISYTAEIIMRLGQKVSKQNGKLVVVIIPSAWQIDPSLVEWLREFDASLDLALPEHALAQELHDIPILDLSGDLKGSLAQGILVYMGGKGHFTEGGHRVAADTIAAFLKIASLTP